MLKHFYNAYSLEEGKDNIYILEMKEIRSNEGKIPK